MDEYVALAKEKHGYNVEQVGAPRRRSFSNGNASHCMRARALVCVAGAGPAQALGMLFWHKHDIDKSLADLPNFTPFPDEWTVEDKVLFEQAFSFHGKSFHRIQQMVSAGRAAAAAASRLAPRPSIDGTL